MVLIVFALPITQALLFARQNIILILLESLCGIYQCMIIEFFATSKGIRRGLFLSACLQLMIALCLVLLTTALEYGIFVLMLASFQGILRLRGRPTVAFDQQGLVFAVAMEAGAIKLFDSRSYDKGPFDTFLVGGDTAEVCDIKFSNDGKSMLLTTTNNNIYVLDAYGGEKRCGFSLEPSPNTNTEATFTPDGQYVVSGSGDGTLHAWNINTRNEVACWNGNIGVVACLKWAPRRAMFVAASSVLSFWIPNPSSNSTDESTDPQATVKSDQV
ncbi:protein ANTHESIS POMOTING FACTOR 1 isoform X3 [Citrus sinensis]|nr:protein ANTHESIS POMOTING FACTOR 1 isoform X3 [Citrus sinensis]XP_052289006.1 protein ANTHESIS POMOTING FACTOR 1 isoform X3 [Citrus sinensis]